MRSAQSRRYGIFEASSIAMTLGAKVRAYRWRLKSSSASGISDAQFSRSFARKANVSQ